MLWGGGGVAAWQHGLVKGQAGVRAPGQPTVPRGVALGLSLPSCKMGVRRGRGVGEALLAAVVLSPRPVTASVLISVSVTLCHCLLLHSLTPAPRTHL